MDGKVKGLVFSAILIIVALILMPVVISGVHDAQTDSRTQAFAGCVVAAGATDVTLTVGYGLWNNSTDEVTGLTATGAGAVPVAATYTPATRVIHITGLGADTPQNITVTHNYDSNTAFNGVNSILGLTPLLVVVGIILVAIVNGFWTLKTKK